MSSQQRKVRQEPRAPLLGHALGQLTTHSGATENLRISSFFRLLAASAGLMGVPLPWGKPVGGIVVSLGLRPEIFGMRVVMGFAKRKGKHRSPVMLSGESLDLPGTDLADYYPFGLTGHRFSQE